jgi:succinate-semialdehyde dehydrogenase/glutarate-semialdehyde dehydrogenase
MGKTSDIIEGGAKPVPLRQWINGAWVDADDNRSFDVHNPATGQVLFSVPASGASETRRAIEAASTAFAAWSQMPAKQRAIPLHKVANLMRSRQQALARLIAMEEGKPITEARGEVNYAADFLSFFAEEAQRVGGETIPSHLANKRLWTIKQPIGVAGLITIWNFPAAGITRPLGAALAAGCTAVVKPAEQTPLSAIAIFELFEEADLPAGVANLITAIDPVPVGRELIENPLVRKISFTGSTEVGRTLMRGAAEQIKRITLELGGHAPLIVFEDADIELAVNGAVASKFRNSGQTCVAVNRIYVHESIYSRFVERFVDLCKTLKVGNPLDESVRVGPLIDKAGLEKVESHIADAISRGAKVLIGGKTSHGLFFPPTVLVQLKPDMLIMREETFGPVAPIVSFVNEDEVVAAANELPQGLAAYFYTRDANRCARLVEKLRYGIVGVNDSLPGAVQVPFGGIKQSGIGKEGGRIGLEEFLDTKFVSMLQ